jgi:hypothetical protein
MADPEPKPPPPDPDPEGFPVKSCETHSVLRLLRLSPAGIGSHFVPPGIRSKVLCGMPLQTEERAFSLHGLRIPTSFDGVFLQSTHDEVRQRRNRSSNALRPDECIGSSNSDLPGIESGTPPWCSSTKDLTSSISSSIPGSNGHSQAGQNRAIFRHGLPHLVR